MKYRVDNLPWIIRPLYWVVTSFLGLAVYAYYSLCSWTCRIEIAGIDRFESDQNFIFCFWHECWWSYFAVVSRHKTPHVWINHPAAYMRPIHVAIRLFRIKKLILGSSGEEGRRAADRLVGILKEGHHSTTISPDGPNGPPRLLKKGVLHIAAKSKVPIVPMYVCSSPSIPIPSWDGKKFPLPFSRIKITFHEVIEVTEENFETASQQLTRAMTIV